MRTCVIVMLHQMDNSTLGAAETIGLRHNLDEATWCAWTFPERATCELDTCCGCINLSGAMRQGASVDHRTYHVLNGPVRRCPILTLAGWAGKVTLCIAVLDSSTLYALYSMTVTHHHHLILQKDTHRYGLNLLSMFPFQQPVFSTTKFC